MTSASAQGSATVEAEHNTSSDPATSLLTNYNKTTFVYTNSSNDIKMASGLIHGKPALLLTPLVGATCSLFYARDENLFLSNLTDKKHSAHANKLLPTYFERFFYEGFPMLASTLGSTFWGSLGAIYATRPLLDRKGSYAWYVATAALSLAHLGFVPLVAGPIKEMIDGDVEAEGEEGEEKNMDRLKRWLQANKVRMLTVDLAAFVCSFIAVAKTLQVD